MVFSIALRMLCNEDSAKDVVQETFIRVWKNISHYEQGKSVRTWIYTIATRLCLDVIEKECHTMPMPENEELLSSFADEQSPEQKMINSELAKTIKALTDRLSPKQRVVFTLIYLENLDTNEVKEITGMDAVQIKSNLYEAKKRIKEQLKRLGYER